MSFSDDCREGEWASLARGVRTAERRDPNDWIPRAAGAWFDGAHGEGFDLASRSPYPAAYGTLTPCEGHYSLELHGLSRAEVERVLQVLKTGY